MFPVLQIGSLSIQSSGLIILAGIWLALTLSERVAPQLKMDQEVISNLIFYSLIAALLGARLSYAFRFPAAFIEHPASLISFNPGLLDPWGAALAALLVALIYGQRRKLDLWKTLDALTPAFAMLVLALALSQMASGVAYGLPTDLPWAIDLWGASRHPTQIYLTLTAALILYLLVICLLPLKQAPGRLFLAFLALTAFSRVFLDAFRGDPAPLLLGLRASQVLAWLLLALSLALLSSAQDKNPQKP